MDSTCTCYLIYGMYFNFQSSYNNQVHVHVTTVKVNGTGNETCKYCNMCIFFVTDMMKN